MNMPERCTIALVVTLVVLVLPTTTEGFVVPHLMVSTRLLQNTNPQGRVASIACRARSPFLAGSLFSPADGDMEAEEEEEEQGLSLGAKIFSALMVLPAVFRIFSSLPIEAAQPQAMSDVATEDVMEEQVVEVAADTKQDLDEFEDEDEFDLGIDVDMDGDEEELSIADRIWNKLTDRLEQLDESLSANENSAKIGDHIPEASKAPEQRTKFSIPPYATKEQADLIVSGIEPRLVIPRVSEVKMNPFERMRKAVSTRGAIFWSRNGRKGSSGSIKDLLPDPVILSRQIHDGEIKAPKVLHPAFIREDNGIAQGPSEQWKLIADTIGRASVPGIWLFGWYLAKLDEKESRRKSLIALEKFNKEKARLFGRKDDDDDDDKPKKPSGGDGGGGGGGQDGDDKSGGGQDGDGKKGGGGANDSGGGSGPSVPPVPGPERPTPQDTEESGDEVLDILDSL